MSTGFSLPGLAIKRPVLAWMLMSSLVLFGGLSLNRLGVSQLPNIDFPVLNVSIRLAGSEPTQLETSVIEPIEDSLIGAEGLKSLSVSASQDTASFTLDFELGSDLNLALQDIQNRTSLAARRLPKGIDPIRISKVNPEDQPIVWLSLKSDLLEKRELMQLYRDRVQDRLKQVEGVGDLINVGYQRPALIVRPNLNRLVQMDLSPQDLGLAISERSASSPLGLFDHKGFNIPVRMYRPLESAKDLGDIYISQRRGAPVLKPIQIKQVASVEDDLEPSTKFAYRDQIPAIVVGIQKRRGTNAVRVAQNVSDEVKRIAPLLGPQVKFEVAANDTDFIKASLKELGYATVYAILFTAILCLGFLGSKLATFNILLSIPTSIIGTFIMLYACGFTLNLFTLLSLSLAIGIVVDDSILVLENIARHRKLGLSAKDAARVGAEEVQFSALASSLSIVAIFIPILFMKTIVGRFLFEFGVTMATAIMLSYVESVTLAPMRAASMGSLGGTGILDRLIERLRVPYERSLSQALKHPWKVVVGALILCGLGGLMATNLRFELTPEEDRSRIMLRLSAKPGTSLSVTESYMREVEKKARAFSEVTHTLLYSGGFGGNDTSRGILILSLSDPRERSRSGVELSETIKKMFVSDKRFELTVRNLSLAMLNSKRAYALEVKAQGPRWEDLKQAQAQIILKLKSYPELYDIEGTLESERPELRLVPDSKRALEYLVDVSEIEKDISLLYSNAELTAFLTDTLSKPVLMLLPHLQDPYKTLENMRVRNKGGEWISLSQVTKFMDSTAPKTLVREGRLRTISVFANAKPKANARNIEDTVMAELKEQLPNQVSLSSGGASAETKAAGKELVFALLLGILISYMILASQFNDYLEPLLVLTMLPLTLLGALVGLYVFGQSLNIYSSIGILLLMGIVKKNSILVLDFARELRVQGVPLKESLLQASSLRLRPILMTSASTILGAIPTLLHRGPGAESRSPMALVIVAGMTIATPLGLYLVAVTRSLVGRKSNLF